MARKEDHYHQQRPIHYAAIMPSNAIGKNGNNSNKPPLSHNQSELERAKAHYVDLEDAFQDHATNHDYFGFQPIHESSSQTANFYLQSVETISEVKNTNFSPLVRYHVSRENSRPTTPSDTPPYQSRFNHRTNQQPSIPSSSSSPHNHHFPNTNNVANLDRDFRNLRITNTNNIDEYPAPFTPDAIRLKFQPNEYVDSSLLSSQFKLILPQYFLVKYLGRTTCTQLWGSNAVRGPIDDMVYNARQLSSMNEMPILEACVSTRGLTLTHRHSPTRSKHHLRNHSPEKHQHGLIPLEHISYVMHDVKYSKISSCIVLRQSKTTSSSDNKTTNETVTECYVFLFQSKDHAHRFALSLAEAFNAQKHSSRATKQNHDEKREGRSPQRRSKHRSAHHHERTRSKYDDTYLRDSEV